MIKVITPPPKNSRYFSSTAEFKTAFFAALIAGIVTHLFGLVNPLQNYDSIIVQPYGYGVGIHSGRWFLSILGEITHGLGFAYNLPLVNGLIFLFLVALAAGFLVCTLNIKNKHSLILIGMLFAVFPASTASLYFKFTATYYGVAILFSVLASWIIHRCRFGIFLSACFIALSLGIYQAYTPVTIAIFVLMLIQYGLGDEASAKKIIYRGLYYCASLLLGLILYFLCLKALLFLFDKQLYDYQGINQMGQIPLSDLPHLLRKAFRALYYLPAEDYCGVATTPVIRFLYLMMGVISLLSVLYVLISKRKKPDVAALVCLLCLVFPVAVNFVVIMCPQASIYTLMVFGFAIVPCFPLAIYECIPAETKWRIPFKKVFQKGMALIVSAVVFFYAYEANVSYLSLQIANQQAENYATSLVTQVRMTEGYTSDKRWAFVGNVQDPLLGTAWEAESRYGGNATTKTLIDSYCRLYCIQFYIGYNIPLVEGEELSALSHIEAVKQMPCWPDQGSIKVIGDMVVIKFQELSGY